MAKNPGKGATLKMTHGGSLQIIPQITSISHSGAGSAVVATPTLDSGVGIPYTNVGMSEGGEFACDGIHDVQEADHQFITDLILAPSTAPIACQIIHTDGSATTEAFTAAGVTDYSVSWTTEDVTRFSFSLKVDGLVAYTS